MTLGLTHHTHGALGDLGGELRCLFHGLHLLKSWSLRKTRGDSDSFECAIHACAPACAHCGCKIVGHGVEGGGKYFCCVNCAKNAGVEQLRDRA
ncbi:hypothetical protein PA01_19605 (plasmid) [Azoarcus sp. PA01]|nr:hypothetical protein PA01_19605 [Azoarcus sp. PA01]